jgi:hypothetical protein
MKFFNHLIDYDLCKQGNLVLSYALFLYRSVDYQQSLSFLRSSIVKYNKHGPMWFVLFQLLEQQNTIGWDQNDVSVRSYPSNLLQYYEMALESISVELRWKVYYGAVQMFLRTLVHLRLIAKYNVFNNSSLLSISLV